MNRCPTCRQQFLNVKNIALEKLSRKLNYPCPYEKRGCVETFAHDMVREHQKRCHYRPQTCPANNLPNVKCDWAGIYKDLKEHLMEKHPGDCYGNVDGEIRNLKHISARMCVCQFVFALNEVFFLRFQAKIDNILYAVVQYIGPPENATNYKYKVTFVNKDNTEDVTVMHLTRSFNEGCHEIFRSGNCGKLHFNVVSRLATKDDGLKFKIKMFQVGD
jgi:hypothetical protein